MSDLFSSDPQGDARTGSPSADLIRSLREQAEIDGQSYWLCSPEYPYVREALRKSSDLLKQAADALASAPRPQRETDLEAREQLAIAMFKQEKARADAAEAALSEAASRIECAGPVAHRIDVLRADMQAKLEVVEAERETLRTRLQALADKWRAENGDYPESKQDCADELQVALAERAPADALASADLETLRTALLRAEGYLRDSLAPCDADCTCVLHIVQAALASAPAPLQTTTDSGNMAGSANE